MRRGPRFVWASAGLALLGTALFSAGDANAGPASVFGKGIVITKGNPIPVGDPSYQFDLNLVLSAGASLQSGGFITVYDVPGMPANTKPLGLGPNGSWGIEVNYLGLTPNGYTPSPADSPSVYNVTFVYNGATIDNSNSNTDFELGLFTIGTTIDLNSPPTPDLQYAATLDQNHDVSNGGIIQVTPVPEPTSIVLLLIGAAVLPVSTAFRRRK